MYVPKHFAETRVDVIHQLIRTYPLGTVVVMTSDGLVANHIPFVLKPEPAPYGTLQAHVAKGNRIWKDAGPDMDVLVVFQGPDAYITPSWYPTKRETGQAVPTWNYMVVHAYGRLRIHHDRAWLLRHVVELTEEHEGLRPEPWRLEDAPPEFREKMLKAIVGIEIPIARVIAKSKLSQNRPLEDRESVVQGLRAEPWEAARVMAEFIPL